MKEVWMTNVKGLYDCLDFRITDRDILSWYDQGEYLIKGEDVEYNILKYWFKTMKRTKKEPLVIYGYFERVNRSRT